ncbi:15127_t:CDS:2 [Entrophospora sp. SA101]|nr:15127_t:CDS:2 [Entrophospora sp. SA101]
MAAIPTYGPKKRKKDLEIAEHKEIIQQILDSNLQDTIRDM